jgi:hypothetical protein
MPILFADCRSFGFAIAKGHFGRKDNHLAASRLGQRRTVYWAKANYSRFSPGRQCYYLWWRDHRRNVGQSDALGRKSAQTFASFDA